MDQSMVEQVRRFNRTVTQRIGALDDAFLARDRPLGQARLLWGVGPGGRDVRALWAARARLPDDAAAALVEPLNARQRDRLMAAMAEVERLLLASAIEIRVCDPQDPAARRAVRAYIAELSYRFEDGFDPARGISATDGEVSLPAGLFLLATLYAEPVGCGVLKFHPDASAHLKRMWVAREVGGVGLGRRRLTELEAQAPSHGVRTLRLETHRALSEAIGLYRTAGYREVPAFNDERYAHYWFEKTIGA